MAIEIEQSESHTSQEALRESVLSSMDTNPDDCHLYLHLAGTVVDNLFPDPFYETATLRLLAAIHFPHCSKQEHFNERLGW